MYWEYIYTILPGGASKAKPLTRRPLVYYDNNRLHFINIMGQLDDWMFHSLIGW